MEYCDLENVFYTSLGKSDLLSIIDFVELQHSRTMNELLCESSRQGNLVAVTRLVSLGVDINYMNNRPLLWAIEGGHLPVVKFFVDKGVRIDKDVYPLSNAISSGQSEIAIYLINKGACIIGHYGNDAFLNSVFNDNLEVLKHLFQIYSIPEVEINQLLYFSCKSADWELIDYLLQKGASITSENCACLRVLRGRKGGKKIIYTLTEYAISKDPANTVLVKKYLVPEQLERYKQNLTASDFNMI